ncbi:putative oxidoreductase [Yamadazyma tenuis ATCC 10573]|uniref:Putative oxidoreductase n=1 Tax=Candida tenuis (strain ATCC 10573 / BCRC 21748 / CBS 615 / JCM 9827 / NBRC 10315 / NRRL Y-1498 / VKM Y-70) TaxID=590646 RepID=G3B200_CANTC|nr:putative oxidoreductase [Yamadazyma tenuis ATCC 10573]EGV64570.1 putative oxidoreductase [Yamadazyma tenuis ATCC 10573]
MTSFFAPNTHTPASCSSSSSSPCQSPRDVVQIIVVGAGLIGPRHCQHVYNRPDCKLAALIDHSANGPQCAAQLDTALFRSVDQYLEYLESHGLPYPDGAIIATPNHTHVDLGMKLAAHGIHLLIEKPLHSDPVECKKLIEYCYAQNVKLLIGHHRRFNPYILKTKKNLDKIGRPIAIQGTWCLKKNHDYYLEKKWRVDRSAGGGTLLINLVHDLDLLLYLMGPVSKIYAELLVPQREFEVDEGAILTLSFKNGCKGTFICSDNIISPFNFETGTGENPNVPHMADLSGFYRIFGSRGTLSVPDLNLYHQNSEIGLRTPTPSPPNSGEFMKPPPKPFDLQLNHFINLITGAEVRSSCSGEDALNALLCIETVLKSIDSGKPEYVPDLESFI